ncbi:hypothetical protein IAT40_004914 [Kwoniella sp. CBS 6097]
MDDRPLDHIRHYDDYDWHDGSHLHFASINPLQLFEPLDGLVYHFKGTSTVASTSLVISHSKLDSQTVLSHGNWRDSEMGDSNGNGNGNSDSTVKVEWAIKMYQIGHPSETQVEVETQTQTPSHHVENTETNSLASESPSSEKKEPCHITVRVFKHVLLLWDRSRPDAGFNYSDLGQNAMIVRSAWEAGMIGVQVDEENHTCKLFTYTPHGTYVIPETVQTVPAPGHQQAAGLCVDRGEGQESEHIKDEVLLVLARIMKDQLITPSPLATGPTRTSTTDSHSDDRTKSLSAATDELEPHRTTADIA